MQGWNAEEEAAAISCGLTATYLQLCSQGPLQANALPERATAAAALRCLLAFNQAAKVIPLTFTP